MRRVTRTALPKDTQRALEQKQARADQRRQAGELNVQQEWDRARKTKALKRVHRELRTMAGTQQRCMYCCDSHGTDMEHFWPKTGYPERMFVWPNLLLCCTECGRFKGGSFPTAGNLPLLVDPATDDPWQHLDFDPPTGNIVARFQLATNEWSKRGEATVLALQLDRREALAEGYKKTHARLSKAIKYALEWCEPNAEDLVAMLQAADDHGLLGWCFGPTGRNQQPFASLREQHPTIWDACQEHLAPAPGTV